MSMALVHFGCTLPFTMPSAVELSVCRGVAGYLWPSSWRMMRMYTASQAMMYRTASLASVANSMTCLMIWAIFKMAPLLGGIFALEERKKWPQAWLHAPGLLR